MPKVSDRSDIGNRGYFADLVAGPCVAVSARRAAWLVQQAPAGWLRPSGDRGITLANCLLDHFLMHA